MRRITRRIGLFGGPGAIVKAAGGKSKRATRDSVGAPPPPPPAKDEAPPEAGKKSSWLDWFRGSKPD
jgi:hypothetical protein